MPGKHKQSPMKQPVKCGANKTDGSGDKCKMPAGFGTDHIGFGHCKYHGGSTSAHKIAAAREEARWFMSAGQHVDIEPAQALVEEVRRAAGVVMYLEWKLQQMGDTDQIDLVQLTAEGSRPRAFIQVYREERAHLARVAKLALDAGVAERQVRLAEDQGRLLAQVIRAILNDLNLDEDQQSEAPAIVRKHLMALPAG